MALQRSTTNSKYGITLNECYSVIDNIRILNKHITFDINSYVSSQARSQYAQPINIQTMNVPMSVVSEYEGDNIIAQIYSFVKDVVPEFKQDTTDV
jgi:hypothetical protein